MPVIDQTLTGRPDWLVKMERGSHRWKTGGAPRVGVRVDPAFNTPPQSTISKVGRLGGRSGQSAYAAVL